MSIWNETEGELGSLFGLCRDAVLGVRGGLVVFSNAAADALFERECAGLRGDSLLPEHVFAQTGESFVCTAVLRGQDISVSGVRREGLLLLSIPRGEESAASIPGSVLSELRSTAYNLRMASELILERSGRDEKLSAYAAILFHNYYAMTRLTRNLADINVLAEGELACQSELLDLPTLCGELIGSVRAFLRDAGVALRWECAVPALCVRGDRERLEQLLLNLLSNALLHTSAGDAVTVALRRQGGRAILSVSDNGEGIPAQRLGALFSEEDAGLSGHTGAGMGLRVCQGIVRAHGGALIVESREGRGTEVRVMLPVSEELPLRDADALPRGPTMILTELSPVLGHEAYRPEFTD